MDFRFVFTSLTRKAELDKKQFKVEKLNMDHWETGDYVVVGVDRPTPLVLELVSGRSVDVMRGDVYVGVLGTRYATIEATGSWKNVKDPDRMHVLTAGGVFGRMTSKSAYVPDLIPIHYLGHVILNDTKSNMGDFVKDVPAKKYSIPTLMVAGTSMSAGKTTAAKIVIRQFKRLGMKVLGAKLTGAGRYRDILVMADAGADYIYDFVDVGLPSTVCPAEDYRKRLDTLLSMMASTEADIAVVEIGASPLEPYNGDIAIKAIRNTIKFTLLCASDPYAVYGLMKAFKLKPSLVSGIATNTIAGCELIEKLCEVPAINIADLSTRPALRRKLMEKMDVIFPDELLAEEKNIQMDADLNIKQ